MTTTPAPEGKWPKVRNFLGSKVFRFGLAAVLLIVVAVLLAREIHPSQIKQALSEANMWWVLAAALAAGLSWAGAAFPFMALAKIKIPFWDATLVQVASSFVGVAAPMGLGPVALHIDYLKKRKESTVSSIAVVAFIQVAQIVTSTLMLVVALLFDHHFPHVNFPLRKVLLIALAVVAVLSLLLLVKKLRDFVIGKIKDFWHQIEPEIVNLKNNPWDMVWANGGVFIQTFSYSMALVFCTYAVGDPITVAMGITVFLVGNTLGAAVPVPGGMGSTLAATVGALHLMGMPTAEAAIATVLFRLVSFYLQVPIGAVAFTYMQRKKLL